MQSILEIPIAKTLPLWDRWDKQRLMDRRKEVGETAFKRGFQNIATSDEDLMFAKIDEAVDIGVHWKSLIHDAFPRFTGVDLSGAKRPGNAIVTWALIPESGKKVLIDVRRGAWKSPETAAQIQNVWRLFRPQVIRVENNAYQTSLIDWMKHDMSYQRLPIQPHTTGTAKSHPEYGLPGLGVELENDIWIIPIDKKHEYDCECGTCWFLREARAYPLGTTDDCVMAWWFANEAGKRSFIKGRKYIATGGPTDAAAAARGEFG